MFTTLSILPLPFWVVIVLLAWGVTFGVKQIPNGLGLPFLAVLGTVTVWYVGDALYNDYSGLYAMQFTAQARENAWWQVALFVGTFVFLTPAVHRWMNRAGLSRRSQIVRLFERGTDQAEFQMGLQRLLRGCLVIWLLISVLAVFRLQGESIYYFCPYLSYRANPWSRGRIGAGLDFVLSFVGYIQLFVSTMFGVTAALLKNTSLRLMAFVGIFFSWPFFIFDRTRNIMLAVVLPGVLAWVFLRLRLDLWKKAALLAVCFAVINAWFAFVISHRATSSIVAAIGDEGLDFEKTSTVHHEGLIMFSELCWINTFLDNGAYKPNWGKRYYAELVNPIPRSLWPDKPLIGIDYAVLRGQGYQEGSAGVGATVSTGMIGQGVVNFGRVLGPPFAALLMSLWVAYLARLDLYGQGFGHIPLYGLGLILTFNLGRDITLITLYTFVFGALLVRLLEHNTEKKTNRRKAKPSPPPPGGPEASRPPEIVPLRTAPRR